MDTNTHILSIPIDKVIPTLKAIKLRELSELSPSIQRFALAYLMANTVSFITIEDFLPKYLANLSLSPYLTEVSSHG